jgi:hypothetical protein
MTSAAKTIHVPRTKPVGCVDAFVDRLVELPLSDWLAIGTELSADGGVVAQRTWHCVQRTIARVGLGLTAWKVRDAVVTAAFLASRRKMRWSRDERSSFATARGAAEATALAFLVRDHVDIETLRCLFAPFASCLTR